MILSWYFHTFLMCCMYKVQGFVQLCVRAWVLRLWTWPLCQPGMLGLRGFQNSSMQVEDGGNVWEFRMMQQSFTDFNSAPRSFAHFEHVWWDRWEDGAAVCVLHGWRGLWWSGLAFHGSWVNMKHGKVVVSGRAEVLSVATWSLDSKCDTLVYWLHCYW